MLQPVEVTPKSYPTNILATDWSKRKCFYRPNSEEFLHKVHDLEIYTDDVWLVTLKKAGTTWMQELLWLVMNNFNFTTAKEIDLELRTPFMEFDFMTYGDMWRAFKPIENTKRPRLIKSHLCMPLLPTQIWEKKPKVVYVARNIKDVLVSEFYHDRTLGRLPSTSLDDYICKRMEMNTAHDYLNHITEFYAIRSEPWLYYTSYERMKRNLKEEILNITQFLRVSIDESTMELMLKHLSFEEMKKNPKTNHYWEFEQIMRKSGLHFEGTGFCRKGQINAYKEELSPEIAKKLDEWVDDALPSYNLTMDQILLLNNP
ncbi:sulfotransferase 1E1-like [Haematobia irritans]|uniref:sulfotransferase 1E1-like n=1 Tax=Haematobia irritans TaxID=7368 RepID=UPI003F5003B8